MTRVDVLVIGAGPAGATTAARLAADGFETLVVDKARFPRSKTCGEGLMPAGVAVLRELGLKSDARRLGARPFAGLRFFLADGTSATLDFRELDPDLYGLIWPRAELDVLFLDQARRQGARVLEETTAGDLEFLSDGRTQAILDGSTGRQPTADSRRPVQSRLLLAADGARSSLHRPLGCRRHVPRQGRFGLRRRFDNVDGLTAYVDIYFGPCGEAYVAPLDASSARISLLVDRAPPGTPEERYRRLLASWPRLAERLDADRAVGPVEAAAPIAQTVSVPDREGVLLVGDAAGSVDPVTGQGLSLALRDGQLAARWGVDFLNGGNVRTAAYYDRRREAFEPAFGLAEQLLDLFGQPGPARRFCRALTRSAGLRRRILRTALSLPARSELNGLDRLRLAAGF